MQTKYDNISQSFLNAYPFGSTVTGTAIQKWVSEHADGVALKPDLAIDDPTKRVGALRRHLNSGGQSDAVPEKQRFYLEVEDAKRKVFVVRQLSAVVTDRARGAINKSVIGALNPLKAQKKAVNSIKIDELSDDERAAIQAAHENILAMEEEIKPALAKQVDQIWVKEMARRGIPADQARKIREALPVMTQMQKLLRATA